MTDGAIIEQIEIITYTEQLNEIITELQYTNSMIALLIGAVFAFAVLSYFFMRGK